MNPSLPTIGLIFASLLFYFSSFSQENPNPSTMLDAIIASEMELERFPGVSAVIVKDGQIVWIQSYGMADIEQNIPVENTTSFLLASISKVITGTAAMQLHENNTINLNNDVNNHLPWDLQIPASPSSPVTFRQLMTHTASIRDNFNVMDNYYDSPDPTISLEECMQRYFAQDGADYNPTANFVNSAPGTVFDYSNIATALNGYLVERVTEQPFDSYCHEHIFVPLCMNNTAWFMADFDSAQVARPYRFAGGNYIPYNHYGFADYPSGQLRSNVVDMAHFMIAYLNGGEFGDEPILSAASINEMWTVQFPGLESSMGLNWYLEELYHSGGSAMLWGHNGGEAGSSTDMYLDPENNIGICVLTNGEGDAIWLCDEIYDYALSLPSGSGYAPDCLTTHIHTYEQPEEAEKVLIKVIDLIGREVPLTPNTPLIKIYSDGTTDRVFIVE
ncbi:MAG: class A beta-lactamase-related serine hydrolase [Cryomorphaceae bacterium]|nr:MAG: class A beta-lactamase-related serine hydrolase [Cryomorphaceae bacterium]